MGSVIPSIKSDRTISTRSKKQAHFTVHTKLLLVTQASKGPDHQMADDVVIISISKQAPGNGFSDFENSKMYVGCIVLA